ncbi:MAG: alpha-amylase family glycosyl hydrolase [Bacteroidales bacterium]|nr:alpha-amylase family glycosyl hydrolase [Bacteroidales bacterium]
MKKTLLFALTAIALVACTQKEQTLCHTGWAYDATIYELNTRQFTEEGTFAAAEQQLPTLKALGVDIIWMMPLQPIGEVGRKGTLGSYYAIKDYCAFNPEFGTREDFVSFLNTAHDLGMSVILDWVANHTAPDNAWTQNDGWHYRDSLGNLMVQYDWTDIAKLNYDNQDMRDAMLASMRWWLDSIGIDGFRCDVAGEVPTDFWEWAFTDLLKDYPGLFTLAEAEKAELNINAFDMYYGWELHHIMNDVAQQKKTVDDLWAYFAKADTTFAPYAIRMNFTSNHDENSWNGTEFERMGNASSAMAAFTYVVPGMPLIYTGQEYANNRRLEFFEKDRIIRNHEPEFAMYQELNRTRKENPALWSNELGAPMERLECDNSAIFACVREKDGNVVLGIFNFSPEEQTFTLQTAEYEGDYTCICGMPVTLGTEDRITLRPWEWLIYSK